MSDKLKMIIPGVIAVIAVIWALMGEGTKGKLRTEATEAKAAAEKAVGELQGAKDAQAAAEKALADAQAAQDAMKAKLDKELEVISTLAAKDAKCLPCAAIVDAVKRIQAP
jgi:phage terminase Nu1 subunit (DNA packaging protein)